MGSMQSVSTFVIAAALIVFYLLSIGPIGRRLIAQPKYDLRVGRIKSRALILFFFSIDIIVGGSGSKGKIVDRPDLFLTEDGYVVFHSILWPVALVWSLVWLVVLSAEMLILTFLFPFLIILAGTLDGLMVLARGRPGPRCSLVKLLWSAPADMKHDLSQAFNTQFTSQ